MKEENNKKIYDFIKGNIINGVIIITSFAYIFYGLVGLKQTELTIAEVVAKAGIGIVVGFIIKQCMGENGFNYGYRSEIWTTNRDKYVANCNSANDYIERVDNFYVSEEIEKKKKYRRQNITAANMKYDWFFDKEGNYINRTIWSQKKYNKTKATNGDIPEDVLILTRHQKKVLNRCLKVKIYNLNLFSEYGIEVENDTRREITDNLQRKSRFGKNGLFAVVGAVVGAYFVPMLSGWDWGMFIQSCVQVAIWIACGALELYTNFNYVCVEKVDKLKKKSELIVKFKKGCEQDLYLVNPYDKVEEEKYEQNKVDNVFANSDGTCSLSDIQVQLVPSENNSAD